MDQDAVIKLAEHAKSTVVERLVFQSMDAEAHRQDHTRLLDRQHHQERPRQHQHMGQDAVIKLAERAKSTVVERLVFQSMDAVAHRQDHTNA